MQLVSWRYANNNVTANVRGGWRNRAISVGDIVWLRTGAIRA